MVGCFNLFVIAGLAKLSSSTLTTSMLPCAQASCSGVLAVSPSPSGPRA